MYPAVTEVKDDADGGHCRDAVGFLLWGNRPLKTWLRSQGIRHLETQFLVELEEAEQVIGRQWARRPWSQHVVEVIGWLGRRWL